MGSECDPDLVSIDNHIGDYYDDNIYKEEVFEHEWYPQDDDVLDVKGKVIMNRNGMDMDDDEQYIVDMITRNQWKEQKEPKTEYNIKRKGTAEYAQNMEDYYQHDAGVLDDILREMHGNNQYYQD